MRTACSPLRLQSPYLKSTRRRLTLKQVVSIPSCAALHPSSTPPIINPIRSVETMSAHEPPTSTLQATTIVHIVFLPIAAVLLAFLVYLYLAYPRRAAGASVAAPRWHDPRPRSLLPLLIAAAFTGMLSHVLNALYISQSLPRTSNLDLHIPSLTFTPWLVLMTSATMMQHFPVALLVAAILIVLRERYHALLHRVNEKGDWVPGPFLGWVGKQGASMLITYLLFLLPIASRLTLSLGLTLNDSPLNLPTGVIADSSSWDHMLNLFLIFENCRTGFLGIAVFDIVASSYCLYKEGGFWGVSDNVRLFRSSRSFKQTHSLHLSDHCDVSTPHHSSSHSPGSASHRLIVPRVGHRT